MRSHQIIVGFILFWSQYLTKKSFNAISIWKQVLRKIMFIQTNIKCWLMKIKKEIGCWLEMCLGSKLTNFWFSMFFIVVFLTFCFSFWVWYTGYSWQLWKDWRSPEQTELVNFFLVISDSVSRYTLPRYSFVLVVVHNYILKRNSD